jgi:hypothetical protein
LSFIVYTTETIPGTVDSLRGMLREIRRIMLLVSVSRRPLVLTLKVTLILLYSYLRRLDSVDLVFIALF